MSKSFKIILLIVVIIAVGVIGWCYFGTPSSESAPVTAPLSSTVPQQVQPVVVSNTPVSGLTTSPSDNSNAALSADLSVISGQATAMNQDSAAANQTGQ